MTRKIKSYAMSFALGAGVGIIAVLPIVQRIVENVTR